LPETSCQGLFNQIHEKATKKVPEADFSSWHFCGWVIFSCL